MSTTLDNMPENARLWVYQSDRPFTPEEEKEVDSAMASFVAQWAAHGQPLKAAYSIEYHQFIVLAVDESYNLASGCSIDASVGVIRQIQEKYNLNLLDRTKIAFLIDKKVALFPMNGLKQAVQAGELDENTPLFNNMVDNAGAWKSGWVIPAKSSWASRYFS